VDVKVAASPRPCLVRVEGTPPWQRHSTTPRRTPPDLSGLRVSPELSCTEDLDSTKCDIVEVEVEVWLSHDEELSRS